VRLCKVKFAIPEKIGGAHKSKCTALAGGTVSADGERRRNLAVKPPSGKIGPGIITADSISFAGDALVILRVSPTAAACAASKSSAAALT
jgi:hypothetical protein